MPSNTLSAHHPTPISDTASQQTPPSTPTVHLELPPIPCTPPNRHYRHGDRVKQHFETLDGLRGTAALCVLAFHIGEGIWSDIAQNPFGHAYLAVDFFFALSGFVIAHAYGQRLAAAPDQRLTFKNFLLRRLIRLHPMVLPAMVFGLASFLFDPFAGDAQTLGTAVSAGHVALVFLLILFLFPSPSLPNRYGETHSLDGPAWSLTQEYLGSILYGAFGWRLPLSALIAIALVTAAALGVTGWQLGALSGGWGWPNAWVAPLRMIFSFTAGIILYRTGYRVQRKFAFVWLSAALVVISTAPHFGWANGLFDWAIIVFVLPLVLLAGSGQGAVTGRIGQFCRLGGRLSYPIYIIHYPAIYMLAHWQGSTHPSPLRLTIVAVALYLGVIATAWLLLRYYDEPARAWLTRRFARRDALAD